MDKIYEKFIELMDNNKDNLEEIQLNKVFSVLQKLFEVIFNKIYQKNDNNEFNTNCDKYSLLTTKFIIKIIESKKDLSSYLSPIVDRQLSINNKYYFKFISNRINPQFKNLLIKISYKILYKYAPHTTNPRLLIINEDNYKDLKCPIDLNQNLNLEILSNSFFFMELLNNENKISNYLLTSVEYFYSLGKIAKSKVLNDINKQDISRIINYIKLGFILSNIIKYTGETFEIKINSENFDNIIVNLSILNYIYILMKGKMDKNISLIVLFYFIKYGGIRNILKNTKKFLYFCKTELNKKELPIIELLIIKNFWNIQVSLLLFLIKLTFCYNNNFYILSILEHETVQNFNSMKEIDSYVQYLILNDFIEIFFDKDDYNKNVEIINDIELYSKELTRVMYILFDRCIRLYSNISNPKKEKINVNELFKKGYHIYEIMQVTQEGQRTNEDIIKNIDSCRNNEKVLEDKDKEKDINNNKEKKILNKNLFDLEKLQLNQDTLLVKNITNIFPSINSDLDSYKKYSFSKENFLNTLNFIYKIFENCNLSNKQINDMKKMNIKYRIKSFEGKEDLLPYLEELFTNIKKLEKEKNNINKEEILKKQLNYLKFMNYSILRYKTLTKFYETVNINNYIDFIYNNNLIENSSNSIKDYINNKNEINAELIKNLIYENYLLIYILFCLLENSQKNFEKEKIIFLDSFLFLLKESNNIYNTENKFIYNEAIISLGLQIIIQFFNKNDKSEEHLKEYLIKENLFKYLLDIKFNSEDANNNFYENQFRYFITLEESFKQFILKIFSEKNLFGHLLESIFKYLMANINPENYEIDVENFVELCSDYLKKDNKDIFINSIKNVFDIIKKENKYLLKLKPELEKEIEKMKEEINKGEKNQKKEKKNMIKGKDLILSNESIEKNNLEEKIKNIKFKWTEDIKILFNILLEHICNTCDLIQEDILKEEKYQKFSRNYIFDLDTSLSGLNCILHIYPSFIYLLSQFNCKKNTTQMNFLKYLIRDIFPLLNYYHYCISWPEHVCHKEDLENNFTKEKKEVLRQYNTKANSFQSFFESFRNINIIASITHSITYKRRNMDNDEINLINQCRKEILDEINIILKDIDKAQNDLNEFNFLLKNNELYPKNVTMFKSCITVLYSMSEFINNSDIFNQFNPFEIADLIFNKDYSSIISSISHILKKMKIDEKNSIFHEMGIKYLNNLFKYIKINNQKKQDKKDKKEESDKKDNHIKEDINMNINEEEDDIIMEQEEDSSEQNIRSISRRSIENEEEEINEEEEYEEEELNPENILEENNVEEEDLFSLMHSEENEEDEDSNEVLNNSENPLDLNNINMRIIQNENDNDLDSNSSINSAGRFIANENDYYHGNLNYNYNEENILFYEPYTEYNLESKSKIDFLNFYEEFIVFPFLVLRAKSKNNLIYFSRQKINIDIFSNVGKEIVNKSKSMFLYYYLFPFDLNYNKYFDFCLIGLKDKTIKAYYNEIEKILSEFLSMYSINNVQKIKEICKEITDKIKKDSSIYQINDNKINEKEKKDEIQKPEEKNKNNLDNKNVKDDSKEKNKEKEEESKPKPDNNNNDNIINTNNNEQNNNNDNLQFILELPQDLREEILRDLDPNIVPNLSPELRNEYNRVMNRNELLPLLPFDLGYFIQLNQGPTFYELRRLKYKKKNLLNILAEENNLNKNEEDILISTFDDEFLENMILYDVKDILIFKRKNNKKFNDYGSFMNILINNEILRYKILDILLNLWICDPSYLNNLIKEEKINQNKNSFLDK